MTIDLLVKGTPAEATNAADSRGILPIARVRRTGDGQTWITCGGVNLTQVQMWYLEQEGRGDHYAPGTLLFYKMENRHDPEEIRTDLFQGL